MNTIIDHHESSENLVWDYISSMQAGDLSAQMEAVGNFIFTFRNKFPDRLSQIFIQYFPKKLFEEFKLISEGVTYVERYHEKKVLFFDVFTSVFSDVNLPMDSKTKPFVLVLLKLIKTPDTQVIFNPDTLMDSINNCIKHEPTKILFINENAIFYLLNFFQDIILSSAEKFWRICEYIYTLTPEHSSSLCLEKLSENINQIMHQSPTLKQENCLRLLITVIMMAYNLNLLNETNFNVTQFYEITMPILGAPIYITNNRLMVCLSKIWSQIINKSQNRLKIDNINKLIFLSAIFSIDLSYDLLNVLQESGNFELTCFNKQKLYIIYLTLVAFPLINQCSKTLLFTLFNDLHWSIQKYIHEKSLSSLPYDDQFHVLQYYLKSCATLDIQISAQDEESISPLFLQIVENPSLKLHSQYLISNRYLITQDLSNLSLSYNANILSHIENFLNHLILALSDETYIHQLLWTQRLFLYEDLKLNHLSMIDEDFIKIGFTECESNLINDFQYLIHEDSGNAEYVMHIEVLSWILLSFNESYYLDKNTAPYYISLCKVSSNNPPHLPSTPDISNYISDSLPVSNASTQVNIKFTSAFRALLKYFSLIYELKFIFGDINSKFNILNIVKLI
ncbi:hypothetical protein RF11_02797 [Thelohanellus kitauei]|uniref:Dymeclin n=1 Tax=Thelohanellus kitauei TaxID=669202 RepID=A0A0C2N7G0_THEKT|nr:hypothetical protein RF11_02797 [Thelohanellus kitauei]